MYVCINAKLCINQNKVCDGNRDCPLGDDEKNCITISQFKANEKNFTYQSTGNSIFPKIILFVSY